MANTQDTRQKFVELRARGFSYDKIAKQIGISKPTLINWSKQLSIDIQNMRKVEEEATLQQYAAGKKHGLELLDQQLKAVRKELSTRDYSDYKTNELLELAISLQSKLTNSVGSMVFIEEGDGLIQLNQTKSWVA